MDPKTAGLQKAALKSLAAFHKSAASHNSSMASQYEKSAQSHEAHATHHESMMGKAEDPNHADHKASASFHKTQAAIDSKMHKACEAHAQKCMKIAAACEADDAKKVLELMEIPEETPTTMPTPEVNKTVTADPANPTPAPVVAAPAAPADTNPEGFGSMINKALDNKLGEAVNAAFERVLSSDDFSKRVDEAITKKMLEKLGGATVPTTVQSIPVPRETAPAPTGPPATPSPASITKTSLSLDPELAELCNVE